MVFLLRLRLIASLLRRFWPLAVGAKRRWDSMPETERDRRKQQVAAAARQAKNGAVRVTGQLKKRR